MDFFACVLLHTILGFVWKSVTALTPSLGWSIVRVGTVMIWCWGCWYQYQLVSTCIEQIYCALTTNYPEVISCPPIGVLLCSVYASDLKMITQNPLVAV